MLPHLHTHLPFREGRRQSDCRNAGASEEKKCPPSATGVAYANCAAPDGYRLHRLLLLFASPSSKPMFRHNDRKWLRRMDGSYSRSVKRSRRRSPGRCPMDGQLEAAEPGYDAPEPAHHAESKKGLTVVTPILFQMFR